MNWNLLCSISSINLIRFSLNVHHYERLTFSRCHLIHTYHKTITNMSSIQEKTPGIFLFPFPTNQACCSTTLRLKYTAILFVAAYRIEPGRKPDTGMASRIWSLIKIKHPVQTPDCVSHQNKETIQLWSFLTHGSAILFSGLLVKWSKWIQVSPDQQSCSVYWYI